MPSKVKIGIIGSSGIVGSALKKYLEKKLNFQLFLYDKGKDIGSIEEANKADYIYICVPTPFDKEKGCDTSIVEGVISQIKDGKIVIIKSTIIPGTTEKIQRQRPNLKILFNPEFLRAISADQDMNYPDRQIIGYTKESYCVSQDVMQQLPLAPFEKIVPATVAELVKYAGNTWIATRVIFANMIYDISEKLGIDYELVSDIMGADKRIGRTHLKVWHDGYRGYGEMSISKCIPKDSKSLITFGKNLDIKTIELLEKIDKINSYLWENYGKR